MLCKNIPIHCKEVIKIDKILYGYNYFNSGFDIFYYSVLFVISSQLTILGTLLLSGCEFRQFCKTDHIRKLEKQCKHKLFLVANIYLTTYHWSTGYSEKRDNRNAKLARKMWKKRSYDDSERLEYLQTLVTEFQDTDSEGG